MASRPLSTEQKNGICVMSYLRNRFLRKNANNSVLNCVKFPNLNFEKDIAKEINIDRIPVQLKCKSIRGSCGKPSDRIKTGFFKSVRAHLKKCELESGNTNQNNFYGPKQSMLTSPPQNVPDVKLNDNLKNEECTEESSVVESFGTEEELVLQNPDSSLLDDTECKYFNSTQQLNFEAVCQMPSTHSASCLPVTTNTNMDDRDSNHHDVLNSVVCQEEVESPVASSDNKSSCLTSELAKLSKYGWYWGPLSSREAEERLKYLPDGAFLVRDSSANHYLLSLSFKSSGKILHTRIEYSQGLFSFYQQPEQEGFPTIWELIEHSVSFSQSAVFCYSKPRNPGLPSFPVRLTMPVSRFTQVRSLQYLCRFVIRESIRDDNIEHLPLPTILKSYIQEGHY